MGRKRLPSSAYLTRRQVLGTPILTLEDMLGKRGRSTERHRALALSTSDAGTNNEKPSVSAGFVALVNTD